MTICHLMMNVFKRIIIFFASFAICFNSSPLFANCKVSFMQILQDNSLDREAKELQKIYNEWKQKPNARLEDFLVKLNNQLIQKAALRLQELGYQTRILKFDERALMGQDILEVLPADASTTSAVATHNYILKNFIQMAQDESPPNIIISPLNLMIHHAEASWNPTRHTLTLSTNAFSKTDLIPESLIHERMHYEMSQSIAHRKQGAFKGFYGRIRGNVAGRSSYSRDGFVSFEEVKAWRTSIRAREVILLNKIKNKELSQKVVKIVKDNLLLIYEAQFQIAEDILGNIEPIAAELIASQGPQAIRKMSLKFRHLEWAKGYQTPTAILTVSKGWFKEALEWSIPLVGASNGDSSQRMFDLLKDQIGVNISTIQSYRDYASKRMMELKALNDDLDSFHQFLRLQSPY